MKPYFLRIGLAKYYPVDGALIGLNGTDTMLYWHDPATRQSGIASPGQFMSARFFHPEPSQL